MTEVGGHGESVVPSRSFEELYRTEFSSLAAYAAIVSGERAAGEDLAQEAFTRLAARWDRVRHYEQPVGWLRLVVYRLGRRWSVRRRGVGRLGTSSGVESGVDSSVIDSVDLVDAIRTTLTKRQRQMVALRYVYDLDAGEIAEELSVSASNVRATLHNARGRLAASLRHSSSTERSKERG